MIRKLPSGEYRLYSRKINPKTGKRRTIPAVESLAGVNGCGRLKNIVQVEEIAAVGRFGPASTGGPDVLSSGPQRFSPFRPQ